jgi:predicted nucleic acid-binding protein
LAPVYFDTSVFFAIFKREPAAKQVRELLVELQRQRVRIYTSIITIQEISVGAFRRGRPADTNYERVGKLARIQSITREIALTAAKLEAAIIDARKPDIAPPEGGLNRRRKWDCFHVATAMTLGCRTFYALDTALEAQWPRFGVPMAISRPRPVAPAFDFMAPVIERKTEAAAPEES